MKAWWRKGLVAVRTFAAEWSGDNASLLAAGVTFYTTFSLAPLLALVVSLGAHLLGEQSAQQELVESIARFVSPRTAEAVGRITAAVAAERSSGMTIVSAAVLLVAASAVFRNLRAALDVVMDVPEEAGRGWLQPLISRVIAVLMAVAIIVFLVLTVITTSALAVIRQFVPELPAGDLALWRAVDLGVSTLMIAVLFAVTLRYVPDVRLKWRHVGIGAGLAALLFSSARFALALYLSRSDLESSYGAAASLAIVLIAVYLAVLALFAGAEVTELVARRDAAFLADREQRRAEEGKPARK